MTLQDKINVASQDAKRIRDEEFPLAVEHLIKTIGGVERLSRIEGIIEHGSDDLLKFFGKEIEAYFLVTSLEDSYASACETVESLNMKKKGQDFSKYYAKYLAEKSK